MPRLLFILAASLGLGSGCAVDTVQFLPDLWVETTSDSGVPFGSGWLAFDHGRVSWRCDATQSAWTLRAYTVGPASGGTLWLAADGRTTESHELTLIDASPDGRWDLYQAGPLADGVSDPSFTPGETTRFDCDERGPGAVVTLRDRFGELADCVRFGPPASALDALIASSEVQNSLLGGCSQVAID